MKNIFFAGFSGKNHRCKRDYKTEMASEILKNYFQPYLAFISALICSYGIPRPGFFNASSARPVEFGNLLRRQIGVIRFKFILEIIPKSFQNLLLLFRWQRTDLFNYFGNSHGGNLFL